MIISKKGKFTFSKEESVLLYNILSAYDEMMSDDPEDQKENDRELWFARKLKLSVGEKAANTRLPKH